MYLHGRASVKTVSQTSATGYSPIKVNKPRHQLSLENHNLGQTYPNIDPHKKTHIYDMCAVLFFINAGSVGFVPILGEYVRRCGRRKVSGKRIKVRLGPEAVDLNSV